MTVTKQDVAWKKHREDMAWRAYNHTRLQRMFDEAVASGQAKVDSGEMTQREVIWYVMGVLESSFGVSVEMPKQKVA
jgi:hypothetical protein